MLVSGQILCNSEGWMNRTALGFFTFKDKHSAFHISRIICQCIRTPVSMKCDVFLEASTLPHNVAKKMKFSKCILHTLNDKYSGAEGSLIRKYIFIHAICAFNIAVKKGYKLHTQVITVIQKYNGFPKGIQDTWDNSSHIGQYGLKRQ